MNLIEEKYWNLMTKSVSGLLSREDEVELENWLAADPIHQQLLQELKMAWNEAKAYGSDYTPDTDQAWMHVSTQLGFDERKKVTPVRKLTYWFRAAAAVFVLAIISWFVWQNIVSNPWTEITATKEIRVISLPDGSKVWLSQESTLRYLENLNELKERKVVLEGEAFFEVSHNSEKPFVVEALETETKVLGTSFNVSARNGAPDIHVSVLTGKVQFRKRTNAMNQLILEPGTQGIYTKVSEQLIKKQTANQNFLFWKDRKLNFINVTVRDAFADLENSYDVRFELKDSSITEKRITTSFEKETIEQIITELSVLLDVTITKTDSTYLVRATK
jgi:ferric-dicitrate binding protein FerR (iron transport regulator)